MRPGWDAYFSGIAVAVSERADCSRSKVGAVIVGSQHRIVSTGYNGSPPGGPSCLAGECPRALNPDTVPGSPYVDCIAVHAEANAIVYAGRDKTQGGTLYVTRQPCHECSRLIQAAGITRVVWS